MKLEIKNLSSAALHGAMKGLNISPDASMTEIEDFRKQLLDFCDAQGCIFNNWIEVIMDFTKKACFMHAFCY